MLNKSNLSEISLSLPPNPHVYQHIPVACHIDDNAILTKNGEVIFTLEIDGQNIDSSLIGKDIRSIIRDTISELIVDPLLFVHVHTLRSRKNIMPPTLNSSPFTENLNNEWCKKNNFDKQLVNTIYISIVRQGITTNFFDFSQTLGSLIFPVIKAKHKAKIQQSLGSMKELLERMNKGLSKLNPKILGIKSDTNGTYSELLMFYYNLVHFEPKKVPLPIHDASNFLSCTAIKFHFNHIEIKSKENTQYAAIFSLKSYQELSTKSLDRLCHLGMNFIITETMMICPDKLAKIHLSDFKKITTASLDKTLDDLNNINNLTDENLGQADFCQKQILFCVHSDDQKFFQEKIKQIIDAFADMGLPVVREDYNLPKLYWSMLPGNFKYLEKGRNLIGIKKQIGAFCSIHHHQSGNFIGSKWGQPISLLRTSLGFPFFINFHNKDNNGNTLVLGPQKTGKTTLIRFLLSQANKLKPKLIYIDLEGGTKKFIESLDGFYHSLQNYEPLKLNPFEYSYYNNDPKIFAHWLQTAIYPASKSLKPYETIFLTIAEKLMTTPNLENKAGAILELLKLTEDATLINGFNEFMGSEAFSTYFVQNEKCTLDIKNHKAIAFDFSPIMKNHKLVNSYLGIFLENISKNLDGTPTIIVMTNFSALFDMPYFEDVFDEWLKAANEKNAILIASTARKESLEKNTHYLELLNKFGTQIFLSDKSVDKYFRRAYSLNDNDLYRIKTYAPDKRMFLFKQDGISSVLGLNLKGMEDILNVLESREND